MLGGADNSNGELPSYIIGANIYCATTKGEFFLFAVDAILHIPEFRAVRFDQQVES